MDQEKSFLHDISSPLTSIQLNLENAVFLMEDGKAESAAQCLKLLQACLAQTSRVTVMIRGRREQISKAEKK